MVDSSQYPWNVRIEVGGVTFTGSGMESEMSAEAIATNILESDDIDGVDKVEVFRQ